MKKFLILLSITIIITTLFDSCKKEDPINIDEPDTLIGTWVLNDKSISFNENLEYVETRKYSNDSLNYVIKGNYSLVDDIITLRDLKYTYKADLLAYKSLTFLFPNYKFQISDNSLILIEFGVFNPIGHTGNSFYGNWEADRLIVVYDSTQTPVFLSGNQIMQLDILESPKEYTVIYKDTYGTVQDSSIDGPNDYSILNNDINCDACSIPFATLIDGKLIRENNPETYIRSR